MKTVDLKIGKKYQIVAKPDAGYELSEIYINKESQKIEYDELGNPYTTFTATKDTQSISAEFKENKL